jgi:hypothetical protein
MPKNAQADALVLIRAIRRNIEVLETAVATANHSIVQSRAMLIRLERIRSGEDEAPVPLVRKHEFA